MALVGFMIGLANYGENLDQSKAQDMLNDVLAEVHGHLAEQDEKINHVIELLEGEKVNGNTYNSRTNENNAM